MKKISFISLLVCLVMALTGCNKEAPKHSETYNLTVLQKDWQWDDAAQQFYYHFSVPEITAYVYDFGEVAVYREYNYGTKDACQTLLPESLYRSEDNGAATVYYTQHIDYLYGVGFVEVQLRNSDYAYSKDEKGNLINPEDMFFRLKLIY
ncbi:MAG: hypothetical protein IJ814_00500 [Paludibacteraceae bacterium]|nr:hypothetical protein [Paludibacteraceae bacterium]